VILRSTDPNQAELEKLFRTHLVDSLGEEDASTLIEWVWSNSTRLGIGSFVSGLGDLVMAIERGGRDAIRKLLDVAKRTPEERDAIVQLEAWFMPRGNRTAANIYRDGFADDAKKKKHMSELADELMNELHRMWPRAHQATVRGAVLEGLEAAPEGVRLHADQVVRSMMAPDPLADTAHSSWGG
jgi:hypothetical protein